MASSALLVMDLQVGVVDIIGASTDYLARLSQTLAAARSANIPVIYIVAQFRPGAPEANPVNMTFARNPTASGWIEGSPTAAIHEAVAPQAEDTIIAKRRVSAFTGTDLEVVLRSKGVQHLVLAGIATSGVVLSTVRHAADMDYRITVLDDLCLDRDPEVHEVLTKKIFIKQGQVMESEKWTASLTSTA